MNAAYEHSKTVEARSIVMLERFLKPRAHGFVLLSKGALARNLQETVGDAIFNADRETAWSVELKADDTEFTNLFLEEWSNKNLKSRSEHSGRGSNPGWLRKTGADLLLYHRLRYDDLLVINMLKLKRWAYGHNGSMPNVRRFEEKRTRADQLNDTWGVCVPIDTIEREVGFKRFSVAQLVLWDQGSLVDVTS